MNKKQAKKLPKGWKVWRVIYTDPIGSYAVIASNKGSVRIYQFDVTGLCYMVFDYKTKPLFEVL